MDALIRAIEVVGEAPCEKYHCAKRKECAEGLACSSFRWFVVSGRSLDPRMEVPFPKRRGQYPQMRETIKPTAKIFASLVNA